MDKKYVSKIGQSAETRRNLHTHTHTHTCSFLLSIFLSTLCSFANAEVLDLTFALQKTRNECSGISDAMRDLKLKAGINTAVTGVGTVMGGVALGTGVAKSNVDQEQKELEEKVAKLIAEKSNIPIENLEIEDEQEFERQILAVVVGNYSDVESDIKKIDQLEQKSKTLGNVRTGTLATSTMTNVAGTAIAATNKVDDDLETKINKCISATKDLSDSKLAAKVEGSATDAEIAKAEKIIAACRDWEFVDLKSVNKRATGAAVSSGIGVGTGMIGTITSAVANTEATRKGDEQKEKSLNTTSNVMAGASTVASAAATIFNATQISAIKKAATVADECEGALK